MKYIELSAEIDQALTTICDMALKGGGMPMLINVNKVIAAIKVKSDGHKVEIVGINDISAQ